MILTKRFSMVALLVVLVSGSAASADVCSASRVLYDYARVLSENGSARLNVSGPDAGICQKYLQDAEKRRAEEFVREQGYSPEKAKREAMMDQSKVALYAAVQSKRDCQKGQVAPQSTQAPRDSSSVRR